MATRREILEDLKKSYGNELNITKFCKYMGICRNKAYQMLAGLPYISIGKDKKYLSVDLAKRLESYVRY